MKSVLTNSIQHSTEVQDNVIRQKSKKINRNRGKILFSETLKDSIKILLDPIGELSSVSRSIYKN